jgi:hypothetical protein
MSSLDKTSFAAGFQAALSLFKDADGEGKEDGSPLDCGRLETADITALFDALKDTGPRTISKAGVLKMGKAIKSYSPESWSQEVARNFGVLIKEAASQEESGGNLAGAAASSGTPEEEAAGKIRFRSELYDAAKRDDAAEVRALLCRNQGLQGQNPEDSARTPIHIAAVENSCNALTALIEAGGDVNAR